MDSAVAFTTTSASTPDKKTSTPGTRRSTPSRRYPCVYPDCGKSYSRAEHLHRHELNHNPKEILSCDIAGCRQRFVRKDLLDRHKERHAAGAVVYSSRFSAFQYGDQRGPLWPTDAGEVTSSKTSVSNDDPSGSIDQGAQGTWPISIPMTTPNRTDSLQESIPHQYAPLTLQPPPAELSSQSTFDNQQPNITFDMLGAEGLIPVVPESVDDRQYFGTWLFDVGGSSNDLNLANPPFLDSGLEHTFENSFNPASDLESPISRTFSIDMMLTSGDLRRSAEPLSEIRRQALVALVQAFKHKSRASLSSQLLHFLSTTPNGDSPYLSIEFFQECIIAFWNHVSPQMPFLHRPTFSPNNCHLLLLAVIVMLGSSTLHRLDPDSTAHEYADLADLLAEHLRWEIFTDVAAVPPAKLWCQQALLLLELYEKMFSSIELHERAHIHHASTINLLRRGNPLVGRSGSESPPDITASSLGEQVTVSETNLLDHHKSAWWRQWAKSESQNRVVFAAYLLDCSHSILFGHAAVLSPHEILLPLPCDDLLWSAPNPENMQRADQNLKMYGLKPVSFLDGLRRTVHGQEVKTHPWARKILMYGLISVGWHITHRESILTCFDSAQAAAEEERCRKLLVESFHTWKKHFDNAIASTETLTGTSSGRSQSRRNFNDPHTIYFLANLSMTANVVDFQILAGSIRLLGRRVSSRDKTYAGARVKEWAKTAAGRHAVHHAFKFLHSVLVTPQRQTQSQIHTAIFTDGRVETVRENFASIGYSCRADNLNYGSWVICLATLTIFTYTLALNPTSRISRPSNITTTHESQQHAEVISFLNHYAGTDVDNLASMRLTPGLLALLDLLHSGFSDAETDLQREARDRLRDCARMISFLDE